MYSNRRFMPFFLQKFLTNLEKFIFAAYIYFFIAIYTFFLVVSSEQNLQSVNIDQTLPIFLLMIMLITQLVKKIRVFSPHSLPVVKKIDDLPLAFLLILSIYTLLIFTGNLFHHTLYPVVFCLVAFMASFTRHLENILIVFFTVLLEIFLYLSVGSGEQGNFSILLQHICFITIFSLMFKILLSGEMMQLKLKYRTKITSMEKKYEEDADLYRFVSSVVDCDNQEAKKKRKISSVRAIKDSIYNTMQMAVASIDSYTCVFLLLEKNGQVLKIKELRSKSDFIIERSILANQGVMGAIIKKKEVIALKNLKTNFPAIPYYMGGERIETFMGLPLIDEHGIVRGILCADRKEGPEFGKQEKEILQHCGREIMRAIKIEQIFYNMDRDKIEKENFFKTSEKFNHALTMDQVLQVTEDTANEIVGPDFIAITTYNEKLNQHEIKKVNWSHLKEFEGFVFPNNYGLISSVIKNKHILPHVGFEQHHRDKQIIFCPEISVKGLKSLKVFPLIAMDKPLGTLVVGKKEARFFNFDRENILSRLANFTAISLTNALMYWEMQKLATTDGLTGINNHRRFQESLDDVISRVERYNRQVSLILCDIDHFKLVNDTYGHRMGDNVLKRIARILREEVRGADYVARYGGEEFVIILEETDRKGGKYMAERIREKVQNQVFTSDVGKFSITMSLGICTFPIDAKNKEDLIEKSDQALYYCKEHGRNQSISFDQI